MTRVYRWREDDGTRWVRDPKRDRDGRVVVRIPNGVMHLTDAQLEALLVEVKEARATA